MKKTLVIALVMIAAAALAPHEVPAAELWLDCGPMAVGGRCKTEGALAFYNDGRERQISSEVTCYDEAYKAIRAYDCFPLTDPSSAVGQDLRVVCSSKAESVGLSRDEYNDEYRRCRTLCGKCRYGNWR